MKKLINRIATFTLVVASVFTFSRCGQEEFAERYNDPNKSTSVLPDKLMAAVLDKEESFYAMGYGRYYASDRLWLGHYAQVFGLPPGDDLYEPWYSDGYYDMLYKPLANYYKLKQMYDNMSAEEQPLYEAYVLVAKTAVYCHLLAQVDMFGDVPFNKACRVAVDGSFADSNVEFDDDEVLYKQIIDTMMVAGQRFGSDPEKSGGLKKPRGFTQDQEYYFKADFKKWQIFANMIAFRAAMRISTNGPAELTAYGQAKLKEIWGDHKKYPLAMDNETNVQIPNYPDGGPFRSEPGAGMDESSFAHVASAPLLRNMLSNYNPNDYSGTYKDGSDDPRCAILYCMAVEPRGGQVGTGAGKVAATVYRGVQPTEDRDFQSNHSTSLVRDQGFFWRNMNFDHQIFPASETWFIVAEARQRGWLTDGEAKDAFKEGIKQSIHFFFKYHKGKEDGDPTNKESLQGYFNNPDENKSNTDKFISDFGDKVWEKRIDGSSYANQLDAILTQKWISWNILFCREAWSDLRRTGYPSELVFPVSNSTVTPTWPFRWMYPAGERDFNKNCPQQTTNEEKFYTRLFWADPDYVGNPNGK